MTLNKIAHEKSAEICKRALPVERDFAWPPRLRFRARLHVDDRATERRRDRIDGEEGGKNRCEAERIKLLTGVDRVVKALAEHLGQRNVDRRDDHADAECVANERRHKLKRGRRWERYPESTEASFQIRRQAFSRRWQGANNSHFIVAAYVEYVGERCRRYNLKGRLPTSRQRSSNRHTKMSSKGNCIGSLKRRLRNGFTNCFPMTRNNSEQPAIMTVARFVECGNSPTILTSV